VDGARILLGAVVLPRAEELARPGRARGGTWRYFRPALIAVRAGEPDVELSVPLGWRDRVALSWGRGGTAGSAVGFPSCSAAGDWNVYAGGFHLRRRGDCVPLVVRVGATVTTVRLGVGRACGARS
jgi:hypothetical protein